jgi:hypothetical protein
VPLPTSPKDSKKDVGNAEWIRYQSDGFIEVLPRQPLPHRNGGAGGGDVGGSVPDNDGKCRGVKHDGDAGHTSDAVKATPLLDSRSEENEDVMEDEDEAYQRRKREKRKRKREVKKMAKEERRRMRRERKARKKARAVKREKNRRKKEMRKRDRKKAKKKRKTASKRTSAPFSSSSSSSSLSSASASSSSSPAGSASSSVSSDSLESGSSSAADSDDDNHVDYINNRFIGKSVVASSSGASARRSRERQRYLRAESNVAAANEVNALIQSSVLRRDRKPHQSRSRRSSGSTSSSRNRGANAQTPGGGSSMLPIVDGEDRRRRGRRARTKGRREMRSGGGGAEQGSEDDSEDNNSEGSDSSDGGGDSNNDGSACRSSKRRKMGDHKYQEVVRGKARQVLPGHDCPQCQAFWDAVGEDVKILAKSGIRVGDLCKEHSRHRARFKAPETPENYWNLSMQSVREGSPGMNINESILRD